MSNTLVSPAVAEVLSRLRSAGAAADAEARRRVEAREAELEQPIYGAERAELGRDAPLAVKPDVGELLYLLVRARRPALTVEFGTSLGVSTIYLAAGIRDVGAGRLVSTELRADKAARAGRHLEEAGLADLVDIRVGDARDQLLDLAEPVDYLFLDGSNDLYVAMLDQLTPLLSPGALVVADLSPDDPYVPIYRRRVRDPDAGFQSLGLTLGGGVELSITTA